MPIIRMPDGQQVRFPDEMPKEEIKGLIASKFPDFVRSQSTQLNLTPEQQAEIQTRNEAYTRRQEENRPWVDKNPVGRLGVAMTQGIANAGLNPFGYIARSAGVDTKPFEAQTAGERVAELAGQYGFDAAAIVPNLGLAAGSIPAAAPYVAPLVEGGVPLALIGSTGSALLTGMIDPENPYARMATDILGGGLGAGLTRPKYTAPKQDVKAVKELTKSIGEDALNRDIAEAERTGRNLLEVGGDEVVQAAQQAKLQSPEARKTLNDYIMKATEAQPTRTEGVINEALGTQGKNATIAQIMENAKSQAKPIYEELENIGDLAKFEEKRNIENILLENEKKGDILGLGESDVYGKQRGTGAYRGAATPEQEKSSAFRELVGKGYSYGRTAQDGLFVRRNDGTGIFSVNPAYNDLFDKAGVSKISYKELKNTPEEAQNFFNAITEAKKTLGDVGEQVYVYSPDDYQKMKLFLSEDGLSGVAVKEDGDIVSVFNSAKKSMEDVGSRAHSIMELAKQNGGKKLDAFDTFLPKLYSKHGFKETARDVWNEEYAPKNWNKEYFKKWKAGEPDVVYMQLQEPAPSRINQLVGENQVISDTIQRVKKANSSLKNLPDTDFRVVNEARKALSQAGLNKTELSGYEARQALGELDPILNEITGGKLAQANKLYSDAYQFERASDLGRDVFNPRKSPSDLKTAWNNLSSSEKQAARIGLREEMMNKIGSSLNQTNALNKFLPNNIREKIITIAGEKEGRKIIDEAEQAVKLRDNLNKVFSGSQTAEKQSLRDTLRGIRGFIRNPWESTVDAIAKPFDTQRNIRMAEYLTENPTSLKDAFGRVNMANRLNAERMPRRTPYLQSALRAIIEENR